MTTGMQLNNLDIPSPMDGEGTYRFEYDVIGRNGMGLDVEATTATVTWKWPSLKKTDFSWWTTTLLGGSRSVEFSQAKLFNHLQTLRTFTQCIVHRPTYEEIRSGAYYGVQVVITYIN